MTSGDRSIDFNTAPYLYTNARTRMCKPVSECAKFEIDLQRRVFCADERYEFRPRVV